MKFKIISIIIVVLITGTYLSCKKKDDDLSQSLCNRKEKDCLISLIAGKTWYSVGSVEQPKNSSGFRDTFPASCYAKVKLDIQKDSRGNLTVASSAAIGTLSGGSCNRNVASNFRPASIFSATIIPVSELCFNMDMVDLYGYTFQGRGSINGDGSELRLELYMSGNIPSFGNLTPVGHRCENGGVGERNRDLTPDSSGCDETKFVCSPAGDATYNNVQIFDLTE